MESLLQNLISSLYKRKEREKTLFDSYMNFGLENLALISSGKIKEIDRLIGDLEDLQIKQKQLINS